MLSHLRRDIMHANQELVRRGLAPFTFGNASAIDRETGMVVIKPSGVPYGQIAADMLVITDLDGKVVEGNLHPSTDLPTHLALYRAFGAIGGVVHTHSHFATTWAQAGRDLPCLGTTHADHFHGPVPVTRPMDDDAITGDYEANTGRAIVERFAGIDPMRVSAVLVSGHAPFCWGTSVQAALETASMLEEIARMAYHTVTLNRDVGAISPALHDRHYERKHGEVATYGQG